MKAKIIKEICGEIKRLNEKVRIREARIGELATDLQYHLLFGNKETANKYSKFIFNHQEAIEDLKQKRVILLANFKKVA